MESQTFGEQKGLSGMEEDSSLKKRKFGLVRNSDLPQMMGTSSSSSTSAILKFALYHPLAICFKQWHGTTVAARKSVAGATRSEMQISRLVDLAFPIDMKAICFDHWKNIYRATSAVSVIFENESSN
jgi:hypothetical protein